MEEYSSGGIFSQSNFDKFDKINFQNLLAPDNDAKTKVGGDGQLFLK